MAAEFPHCYGADFHPTYVGAKYSCSICMEETVVDDDESNNHLAHFNGCAHTACMRCLTQWMEGGRYDCPQCRTPCDGIQTVAYTLHVSNQEFMVLDTEIATMQRNIEERTEMNTRLREQLVTDNDQIEEVVGRFGHYGCNDHIIAVNDMEETAGILEVPQHVRGQNIPEVFALADDIRKTRENEMSFKMDFIQKNNVRTAFEIKQVQIYSRRQIQLKNLADMLLSGYHFDEDTAMEISEEEEEEEEEGIGCNICYSCVTGGAGPCVLERTSLSVTPGPSLYNQYDEGQRDEYWLNSQPVDPHQREEL